MDFLCEGKLTLVNDDGKPLPKVVSTENADSDYEVEDVVDDHAIFMASTSLKRSDGSGYVISKPRSKEKESSTWRRTTQEEGRVCVCTKDAKKEDLSGDDLKHYNAGIKAMNLILISIPNGIYNLVDACTTAKAIWKRAECLMQGSVQNKVDRETHFNNEFDQFVIKPGEALVSVYNRFAQLMNDLERNGIIFPKVVVNTKFLNCLQPEWLKAEKLEKSHDPLALVAYTGSSSKYTSPYYVTHPSSVVDYNDDYQGDAVQNNFEDTLTSAMILLARVITQRFSNLTNNRLHTSSNIRNQAIVQGDRVNIQSRNLGHYARNYPKPRVRDSKYFMEQMFLAKQDEVGVILTDEQDDFLFADASRMEEIKELSANICLMARIQPANFNSGTGPSYDFAFLSEVFEITKAKRFDMESQSQFIHDRDTIRYLEQQRDKLKLSVVELKRKIMELKKTQIILKRKMSENKDKYHDTVVDLEARAKKNADVVLKFGKSLQGIFMLGPKPISFYDSNLKHGLGYANPYSLKKEISLNPKLYDASCLDDSKIHMNIRDTEDILDDATKSQIKIKKQNERSNCY
uniref:Retrovirus-related Pol polyprotein from transposon TNT 1-94 n=1 Tax=Tanacetum cinerariifolium TaxID=118510 RepID=A0A6L2LQ66_TANCI|nr:hypothetical protein [Tanacetum cinerariifolium]